jgi:hypothetical protein
MTILNKAYLGGTEAKKAYLGSTLVLNNVSGGGIAADDTLADIFGADMEFQIDATNPDCITDIGDDLFEFTNAISSPNSGIPAANYDFFNGTGDDSTKDLTIENGGTVDGFFKSLSAGCAQSKLIGGSPALFSKMLKTGSANNSTIFLAFRTPSVINQVHYFLDFASGSRPYFRVRMETTGDLKIQCNPLSGTFQNTTIATLSPNTAYLLVITKDDNNVDYALNSDTFSDAFTASPNTTDNNSKNSIGANISASAAFFRPGSGFYFFSGVNRAITPTELRNAGAWIIEKISAIDFEITA